MKQQSILKSTLCLLVALVCNVMWAQTSEFKMKASTTSLTDGNYVLMAMCEKGTGPVFYATNHNERKYQYDTNCSLEVGGVVLSKYVWTIDETTDENGVQHITVTNYDDNTKFFPADTERNKNFSGSKQASLKTEMKTIGGVDYIVLTLDDTTIGYIHANKADNTLPNLSYWPSYGDGGTCIKFTFYPVEELAEDKNAPKVVTAITEDKLYTLECRSGAAHNTARFIGITEDGKINGHSATAAFIKFEKANEENGYYIKIVDAEKYLNHDGNNISASTEKKTAWTLGIGGKNNVANVVTFTIGNDKYLNNNGSDCNDNTCVNLKANTHTGGPGSDNTCSLWEMTQYPEPGVDEGGGDDVIEVTSADALPGDGILRFYRLAIPVTLSAYTKDLESSYDKVLAFWQECEEFMNKMYVPLGMCFEVVVDNRLVMQEANLIDQNIYNAPSFGTELLNEAIGPSAYDVGMWVVHRDINDENTGLGVAKGAYSTNSKGSAYAMTDKRVVAHEIGHLFGALHTASGEGSLMDNPDGEYFAYPSIKTIRKEVKGTDSYNNVAVANNAPQFDQEKMQQAYRIPQGACLAIEVHATDAERHKLMYTAIGCSDVDKLNGDDGEMPIFASFAPQESNVITYSPVYTADVNSDEDFYLLKDGTGVHELEADTYPLSILVNDVPSTAWNYGALTAEPFYSTYAIWEAQVEVVEGDPFKATIDPNKDNFEVGEQVTVKWDVNTAYFTDDSRLRITMSDDYGKTFKYILAENVIATDGQHTVTMPDVYVGEVEVDFTTAKRTMKGGIIKVEEIGGVAYTLTVLNPNTDKGFTLNGTSTEIEKSEIGNGKSEMIFDPQGRRVENPTKGIYIVEGRKIVL